jgi:uncharacterized protein YegJ (DUF2314 family)
VIWLHSHGLAEMGAFDFDILRPSEEAMGRASEICRPLAFAIVEGNVNSSTPRFSIASPGGDVRFVDVRAFNRSASREDIALRDGTEDEAHNRDRAILCEPQRGLLSRFLGGVQASRFLSGPMDHDFVCHFSHAASELMAHRARDTYPVFRALAEEFAVFECPVLAKIGYTVDGGSPDQREHLWFSVEAFEDHAMNATLENEPFQIAGMKLGDKGRHPVERLTDWLIMTPVGHIHPRSLVVARRMRERREELLELMSRAKEQ